MRKENMRESVFHDTKTKICILKCLWTVVIGLQKKLV